MPKKKLRHKKQKRRTKAVGIRTSMDIEIDFTRADLPLLKRAVRLLERK